MNFKLGYQICGSKLLIYPSTGWCGNSADTPGYAGRISSKLDEQPRLCFCDSGLFCPLAMEFKRYGCECACRSPDLTPPNLLAWPVLLPKQPKGFQDWMRCSSRSIVCCKYTDAGSHQVIEPRFLCFAINYTACAKSELECLRFRLLLQVRV